MVVGTGGPKDILPFPAQSFFANTPFQNSEDAYESRYRQLEVSLIAFNDVVEWSGQPAGNHHFCVARLIQNPLVKSSCSERVPQTSEAGGRNICQPLSVSKVCWSKMSPKSQFWTIFAKNDSTQHPLVKRNSSTTNLSL